MTQAPAPADQITACIVHSLRESECMLIVPQEQIRSKLDVSGAPVGFMGAVVTAEDKGGHDGIPGRILIDVAATVQAFTHLDEDADGIEMARLASAVMEALQDIAYPLDGWHVRFPGDWTSSESMVDDAFRRIDFNATLYLQKSST